jgi:uncharacterized protein
MNYTIETNLQTIANAAVKNDNANWQFRTFLKNKDAGKIDEKVHRLNSEVSAQIDCTTCGNCCKSFMISVEPQELVPLAAELNMTLADMHEKYIETSSQGELIVNKIPCHFLSGNSCTVYENRFGTCRDFPHLDKPDFNSRLMSVIQNYAICPIVYNVLELLKIELKFSN